MVLLVFLLVPKVILELGMELGIHGLRIFGNGIKQRILGLKKQIFLGMVDVMQLGFQLEQKDI